MSSIVTNIIHKDFVTLHDKVTTVRKLTIVTFNWMIENVMKSLKIYWTVMKQLSYTQLEFPVICRINWAACSSFIIVVVIRSVGEFEE